MTSWLSCSSFRSIFLLVQSLLASIVIRVWSIVSVASCTCAVSFSNHRPCLKRQRVPPCIKTISLQNTYEDTNFRVILFFASQIIDAKSSESDICPWAAGHLYVHRYGTCSLIKILIIFKLIDEKGLSRFREIRLPGENPRRQDEVNWNWAHIQRLQRWEGWLMTTTPAWLPKGYSKEIFRWSPIQLSTSSNRG